MSKYAIFRLISILGVSASPLSMGLAGLFGEWVFLVWFLGTLGSHLLARNAEERAFVKAPDASFNERDYRVFLTFGKIGSIGAMLAALVAAIV